MTTPQRYLNRMIVFLVLAVAVVAVLYEVVLRAFLHNPVLNGLILAVLLLGIVYSFRRVLQLRPEIRWIEAFRTSQPGFSLEQAPRLLAPLAAVLGESDRHGGGRLSAVSMRYLLDSISSRLDESRDISRYQTGLLIFLGLLGTFWGLLETINAVGIVIADLSLSGGDLITIFNEMKTGLAAPLSGMGTAFSSSLFGLSGSLILGFLDLQATQSQNAFYNEMEEWLSGLTKLSGASPVGDLDAPVSIPSYIQALLERTAESLDGLQQLVAHGEEQRDASAANLARLTERLAVLNEQLAAEQKLMTRLLASQEDMRPVYARIASNGAGGLDDATRDHLRNVDIQLGRLIEETARGREQMTDELRREIKLVSRTIAAAAGDPRLQQG